MMPEAFFRDEMLGALPNLRAFALSLIHDPVYNHQKFLKLIIRSAQKRQNTLLAARRNRRQVKKQRVEQMAYS